MSEAAKDSESFNEETIHLQLGSQANDPELTISVEGRELPEATISSADLRFTMIEEIGRGGMGIVYRARQSSLEREVAIKKVQHREDRSDEERAFVAEARVTGFLDHPNIVPVHDLGVDESGETYLAMKLVDGLAWRDLLHPRSAAAKERAAPMDLTDHLEILIAVCNALGYAHRRGVIHRDLKPANVMVGEYGEVLVMDWGLAVGFGSPGAANLPRPGPSIVGTPSYMAPEMARGENERLGPWTDVYLLGAILCEIVTGAALHRGDSLVDTVIRAARGDPPTLPADLPDELRQICESATERDIAKRTPSAGAFRDALRDFLRHRESSRLAQIAGERLKEVLRLQAAGQGRGLYSDLEEAIAGFRQALLLWDGNVAAQGGESRARIALASVALDRGDLALAGSQLAQVPKEEATGLRAAVEKAVELRQRDQRRRKQLERTVVVAVAAILMGLTIGFILVETERRRADDEARSKTQALADLQIEKQRADDEALEKSLALHDLRRLSDVKVLQNLLNTETRVSVPDADAAAEMTTFLAQSEALKGRLSVHLRSLEELEGRARARRPSRRNLPLTLASRLDYLSERIENSAYQLKLGEDELVNVAVQRAHDRLVADRDLILAIEQGDEVEFADAEDQWQYETLRELVLRLQHALQPEIGAFARVSRRLQQLRVAEAAAADEKVQARWAEAIDRVAKDQRFAGLKLSPITGLLPLGPDPESGLEEFLHLASHAGPLPSRAQDGYLRFRELTGVILVLLPGAESWRGAQSEEPDGLHYDPAARRNESPVHTVWLDPFFISKFELTQGQWLNLFDAQPSYYRPTFAPRPEANQDLRHPVESVSWDEFRQHLPMMGLSFPSEAQWEYAARAGTDSPWWPGASAADLDGAANLPDRSARIIRADWESLSIWPDYEDGWPVHAQVQIFRPNAFGLHHVIGNVSEFCLDHFSDYELPVNPGDGRVLQSSSKSRICRGGSFDVDPWMSRSAARDYVSETYSHGSLGLRPVRSLLPRER